ncbi:glycosyltransferase family 2 protein [Streptomyces sp. NRRL S-481]|uniref:glycosyltransferase family 2 protein n=1 Tax=Streptomyces sp. NRRL S-481 TaxID=1463911 RepID=UPI000ABECF7A|nr:glycosyltransferase family 2 protein [Streptomyces sp. NRRL S-481]
MDPTIACVVPCHNEEAAVGKVVRDLRAALPEAVVYVYDNASTDRTVAVAREAGAIVRQETRKGKGNVIRRAFADVDADALLIIDGDDTYDASRARDLVDLLFEGPYDQVVGARRVTDDGAYRTGHAVGNRVLTGAVRSLFGNDVTDMLSGYRVFSRRFVKSFPALAREFETETEMTIHALHLRLPTAEVPIDYRVRPAGGESKLRTYRDGWRILRVILDLARRERPSLVHTVIAGVLALVSVLLGIPVIAEFVRTGTGAPPPHGHPRRRDHDDRRAGPARGLHPRVAHAHAAGTDPARAPLLPGPRPLPAPRRPRGRHRPGPGPEDRRRGRLSLLGNSLRAVR